jgi:sarcosine oxidase subunit alpha
VNEVFVAGNAAGVTCQSGVLLTGALAGLGAIEYLGMAEPLALGGQRKSLWQELYRIESEKNPHRFGKKESFIYVNPLVPKFRTIRNSG